MKQYLDLENWARKPHFDFFNRFTEPFFGITVQADVTKAYELAKQEKQSFFLYYLYLALKASNETQAFRYRIEGEKVADYDEVHASPTIQRPNGTFGFAYFPYAPNFSEFLKTALPEMEMVQAGTDLLPATNGQNVVHFSALPWLDFTAVSHARHFAFPDACPKITFGKMTTTERGKRRMPVSIHVHHALADGYDVGVWVARFQALLDSEVSY